MKRIVISIVIILVIVTGAWFFFIRNTPNSTGNPFTDVFQTFFPIGSDGNNPDGVLPGQEIGTNGEMSSRFTQVTQRPVANYSIFSLTYTDSKPNPEAGLPPIVSTITDHYLRYVSRANGYVYESRNAQAATQITNILIPNIYEAEFTDNNTIALLRFLRDDGRSIATYSAPIPPINPDGTRTQKQGTYFPDNILSYALSPDRKIIARLTADTNGGIISTSTTANTNKKDVLRTQLKELLLFWTKPNTLYAQTKAASSVNGFLYKVDTAQGRLVRVLGDIPGLTTSISPDGVYVLYSQSVQNGFITRILNTQTGVVTPIGASILPEKCAWFTNNNLVCAGNSYIPEGIYPDSWYAGITQFQDQLYNIDVVTNTYSVVYDGSDYQFDMTNLTLDEGRNMLYFIDKPTGLLWRVLL